MLIISLRELTVPVTIEAVKRQLKIKNAPSGITLPAVLSCLEVPLRCRDNRSESGDVIGVTVLR